MSALGFGVFAGCVIANVAFTGRAFSDKADRTLAVWMVLIAGVIALFVLSPMLGGMFDFLIGAALPSSAVWLLRRKQIEAHDRKTQAELQKKIDQQAARAARREQAAAEAEVWIASFERSGWKYVSRGKMMQKKGQPQCLVMLSENAKLLQFITYTADEHFLADEPLVLNVNQVIGLNIAKPRLTKTRKTSVPVSMVSSKDRSPVARGLVGGALFGPAGTLLGAASGLKPSISTNVEYHTVEEKYETDGEPQLIIGTKLLDQPTLKIQFDPPSLGGDWLYRIKGAQSR